MKCGYSGESKNRSTKISKIDRSRPDQALKDLGFYPSTTEVHGTVLSKEVIWSDFHFVKGHSGYWVKKN